MIITALCSVGGAGVGFVLGAWYGFETDKSDFPIMPALSAPFGAAIGAVVGAAIGGYLT